MESASDSCRPPSPCCRAHSSSCARTHGYYFGAGLGPHYPRVMPLLPILLAAAAPGQDVVQLTSKTQLKELCEALRAQPSETDLDPAQIAEARKAAQARREEAAGRWYRVEVSSKGFAFGRYRAQDQQLELDGDRPLRAIDDMLSLGLDGIDDVSFAGSSEQVTAWTQEKKAKALKLVRSEEHTSELQSLAYLVC